MLGYGSRMTPVNGSVLRAPHAIPGGSAAKTRWGFVKREYRWKRKWVEASQEQEEDKGCKHDRCHVVRDELCHSRDSGDQGGEMIEWDGLRAQRARFSASSFAAWMTRSASASAAA